MSDIFSKRRAFSLRNLMWVIVPGKKYRATARALPSDWLVKPVANFLARELGPKKGRANGDCLCLNFVGFASFFCHKWASGLIPSTRLSTLFKSRKASFNAVLRREEIEIAPSPERQ